MSGVSKEELQRAVCDADYTVGSIQKLTTAADHVLTQAGVDRENAQASLDHDMLVGMVNGMAALSEKALAKLEWIDTAISQRGPDK